MLEAGGVAVPMLLGLAVGATLGINWGVLGAETPGVTTDPLGTLGALGPPGKGLGDESPGTGAVADGAEAVGSGSGFGTNGLAGSTAVSEPVGSTSLDASSSTSPLEASGSTGGTESVGAVGSTGTGSGATDPSGGEVEPSFSSTPKLTSS